MYSTKYNIELKHPTKKIRGLDTPIQEKHNSKYKQNTKVARPNKTSLMRDKQRALSIKNSMTDEKLDLMLKLTSHGRHGLKLLLDLESLYIILRFSFKTFLHMKKKWIILMLIW